jgi:hypothetical protein
MQRLAMIPLAAALTLALAAPGFAQAPAASGSTQGKAPAPATDKAPAPTPAQAYPPAAAPAVPAAPAEPSLQSQLDANNTHVQANKKFEVIKAKGGMTSAQARSKADAKLGAAAKKADADVTAKGEATVAARLAAEFGMTASDLLAERQSLGCSWGELMIARSVRAMSTTEISVADLLELRKDTGWAQIAAGLGLKLGEAVSAVQAEERVAAGLAEPDGKVAAIPPSTRTRGSSKSAAGTAASGSQTAAQAGKDKP